MRILIVGAGIAGMTLAALLDRRGVRPTLVERAPSFAHAGYMLGLYSLGSRVLHGLGLYEKFTEISVEAKSYEMHDGHGGLVKRWSMEPLASRLGPLLSSTRPELVSLLRSGLGDVAIRFGTSVEALEQKGDEVQVRFTDGSTGIFDLVVGADGIHSRVRDLLFGEQPVYHTDWGGWVFWAEPSLIAADTFAEYWGGGRFLGIYPTRHKAGIFAGAPLSGDFGSPGPGRRARLQDHFAGLGPQVDAALAQIPEDGEELFFWKLSDVRSAEWYKGHVVLLGDAAAGFLPTAGIGASMAMESAAVLADELSRTNKQFLEHALSLYVKRRRSRVEAIQTESRRLAKLAFVTSTTMATIRNFASQFFSLESFMGSIFKAFDEPI